MSTPVNRFDLIQQTALLARVRAGDTVRAASKAMGFAEITIFKLRQRDPIFRAALIEARTVGKAAKAVRVRRQTREAIAALVGEPARVGEVHQVVAPAADRVVPPQRRPSDALRAMVDAMSAPTQPATAVEPIAIGRVEGGVLYVDAAMFAKLVDAARRAAQRGASSGA